MQAFPDKLYPMVGLHGPQENIQVNFGTKGIPFVHNPFVSNEKKFPVRAIHIRFLTAYNF